MALQEYAGAIIMEINGREFEVASLTAEAKGNKKLVKTMNRQRRANGFAKTIPEYSLQVSLPIPLSGEPDWLEQDDMKITIYPVSPGGKRITYQGCFVTDMSEKYEVDNEAMRDLTLQSINRIEE